VRKRLQRNGNALDLRLTADLRFALGVELRDGQQDEVEIELVEGGLLIRPVNGVVASSIPPVTAVHPSTRDLLLAVRDLGPARTGYLAAVLERAPQAVSDALVKLRREGWVHRDSTGWVIASVASAWFSHIPRRDWGEPDSLPPRLSRGTVPERVFAVLTESPRPVSELAGEVGLDRSQVHHALKRLEREGRAVLVYGRPVRWRRAPSP